MGMQLSWARTALEEYKRKEKEKKKKKNRQIDDIC